MLPSRMINEPGRQSLLAGNSVREFLASAGHACYDGEKPYGKRQGRQSGEDREILLSARGGCGAAHSLRKVATYGQIALLCGKPKNARQVGYGLNKGLLGEDVPAHRVVNARGVLSGAAAFETFDMQKLLLEGEGVEVAWTAEGWRVDLARYGWKNTLAEAQRLREEYLRQGI